MLNILFVCSQNKWRSPTAEQIYKKHPVVNVRSAGTSNSARHKITAKDIQWADTIFVMEEKHKSRIKSEYTRLLNYKQIQVLDIPDEYQYMDDELMVMIKQSVDSYIAKHSG